MNIDPLSAGKQLRAAREQLGLTVRDVEAASTKLAARYGNDDFAIALSRISDIETKGVIPSIYRLYSMAIIYRRDVRELMAWYGIDVDAAPSDLDVIAPIKTHRISVLDSLTRLRIPVKMDPAFNLTRTTNLSRMIETWGVVPVAFLATLDVEKYTYGYIGTEDFTMYPLVLPGSLVQIDQSKTKVVAAQWRSEYERPIYFVETRGAFICSWCSVRDHQLIVQPHPLSPERVRVFKHPQDAEVVGQVVGLAMRTSEWRAVPGADVNPRGLDGTPPRPGLP